MKFMAKTTMYTATFRDLSLASSQGTLVENPLSGYRDGSISYLSTYNVRQSLVKEYLFLILSIMFLTYGLVKYSRARWATNNNKPNVSLKEPLVFA